MTTLRRLLLVAVSTLLLVVSFASAAPAAELDDLLSEARDSTYTASRLVVSVWGGQTQVSRDFVIRKDGMEMTLVDAKWTMTGNGKVISMGDDPAGVAFVTVQRTIESTRYRVGRVTSGVHASRPCQIVEVMEGGLLRATLIVDDRSGAVLIRETYTAEGDVFRRTTLSEFHAYRTYEAPMDGADVAVEVVMPAEAGHLPASVAGYQLVDAFKAPGGSGQGYYAQGYYTDGLFRFSLFVFEGRTIVSGFDDPMVLALESGNYDMVPTAQTVQVQWQDGSNRFVLLGDLPPDHLAEVLSELPRPERQGMFARWWGRLFG